MTPPRFKARPVAVAAAIVARRLREPSTWAGIGGATTAAGLAWAHPSPETIGGAIAATGAAVAAVLLPEGRQP